ncbi:hypothetical protein DRQ50_04630, partial [bacterium]
REDINPTNDTAGVVVDVVGQAPTPELLVIPNSGSQETVWPEASLLPVLGFIVVNRGHAPDTVSALTVSNLTVGLDAPDQAALDAEWLPLAVATWIQGRSSQTLDDSTPRSAFAGGRVTFSGREWVILPGDTLVVSISAASSLQARDGALLVAGLSDPAHLVARQQVVFASGMPLVSGHGLQVDGFVARQATLHEVPPALLGVGSRHNLVLDIELPSNGYRSDAIYGFNLVNRGSARAGSDIDRMEAWSDDGDGVFSALDDQFLGELVDSGDRWQMTGLASPVPVGGHRFFFTVDVAETARPASDIRMGLPVAYGPGVAMVSDNDGPVDFPLENTSSQGISTSDRVILTSDWVQPGDAYPDAVSLPLLSLVLTNTYVQDQTLQGLVVGNGTQPRDTATQAQTDAIARQVALRLDGNGDGVLGDLTDDPPLGTGIFSAGVVTFSAVGLTLPPFASIRVFVAADLDPAATAEGDRIGAFVAASTDVIVPGAAVVAVWPLSSGAPWTVDGMVASQVELEPVPLQSLGPDEGPALVMDLRLPGNGYRADELIAIAVTDSGTAGPADFSRVQLWTDGGNDGFDAGLLDDTAIADLTWTGDVWSSPLLSLPVGLAGQRVFVTVDAASTVSDSATVRFMVPRDGIRMASANSGPLDAPIVDPGTLILTTSPLRSSLAFLRNASTVGQTGQIRMSVRNNGTETLTGVVPGTIVHQGMGTVSLGPVAPDSFDLAPAEEAFFVWEFIANTTGPVVLTGYAEGTGSVSLDVFGSAPSPTSLHSVLTTPLQVDLYPVVNLPASVNRGQTGLVPLTLTLVNPGDETVADIELTDLRLRLTETDGGAVIVPEDLVERIAVSEGTDIYAALEVLPGTASDINLHFDPPARVTGREPITLGVHIDLKLSTTVPSFVLGVESATWFAARDTVTGASVPLVLAQGSFPIRTNQASLVSPAGSLAVALSGGAAHTGVPGQTDVPLVGFQVANESSETTSSPIHVTRVAYVLRDGSGVALTTPLDRFTRLNLRTVYQELFDGMPEMVDDTVMVIDLAAPAVIAAGAAVTLDLSVDLAPGAAIATLVPVLAPVGLFIGLDGNNGLPVPVSAGIPTTGPPLFVVSDPGVIRASGGGLLSATVDDGDHQVAILDLDLVHTGGTDAAGVRIGFLTLTVLDEDRRPLDPARVFERLRVVFDGSTAGDIGDPSASDGRLVIPLAATVLIPADTSSFRVEINLLPGSVGGFECLLAVGDIDLVNVVTGDPVAVLPAGGTWPLTSGLARIVVPAEELAVGGEDSMPPLLAPRIEPYTTLALTVRNPATPGEGSIILHSLTLTQPDQGLDLGLVAGEIVLLLDNGIVATASNLEKAARSATLVLETPLVIPAGEQFALGVALTVAAGAPAGVLLVQMADDGILAGAEGGTPGGIRIVPESGQSLPLISREGNLGKAGLESSYANFPNPFAAGREQTTFAFSLGQPGRVTLRILTPHGKLVTTLLENVSRGADFHQSDRWSGVNGNGQVVRNGVYIAELVVDFADGTRERVLRKVAVVR